MLRVQSSPNCGPRRDGLTPTLIVIHYTAMESAQAAVERLCDPRAEVSAHYLIDAQGAVTRMVEEDQRAWHAGAGEWSGMNDINSRSIGIELDNRGTHPFSAPQMDALEVLLGGIMQRWKIPAAGVIGHSDMAPGRKSDPGPHFDWARLERVGLAQGGTLRPTGALDASAFREAARSAGYTAKADGDMLLRTTRLRHAPWRTGPLQAADFRF
ncbi:N-acetylmuramoyl-L-alanine amidase [Sulfitobacter guttiformis]|uniref:N-acetylmuramoyl-L-alanine amidase n=1 Tax=Sulfitobacter guttiformis TaxID=74349 RepID=A0A420DK23_9RHOB|nr:N-acetylmuramoyl-L-alanine amidase [Sulfitobacter guttiformis]KIN71594.1 N-acetylmuramyl-L-alanine amidase, negative regulator of AmpC, AmpD [Sulfitobacter guttiformis KCTC 32187]RKE94572.1 N-acetylmuramoyl-L-alanine amidase [Sulfitobacter guttiformis]